MIMVMCITVLAACGKSGDRYEGTTWKLSGGEAAGVTVTEDQLASFGEMTLDFKKDNVISLNSNGEAQEAKYSVDGKTVTIKDDSTEMSATVDGDEMSIDMGGVTLKFKKQ